jgi:hypothetical protein
MSTFTRLIYAGAGLVAVLFVLDVFAEPAASTSRVNRTVQLSAIDWPHVGANPLPTERWYASDVAPAVRIQQAFAQFMPGEGKRPLRYSAAEAVTQ